MMYIEFAGKRCRFKSDEVHRFSFRADSLAGKTLPLRFLLTFTSTDTVEYVPVGFVIP